ncbi:MAG: hypothetical protein HC883_03300 [Bdellovibrionaceae bacterium]|nr:hypothetical protein [Pseudobdellovibrionaceae bacterium]
MSDKKLLNYTRKYALDVDFMPRPELYMPPFERVISRLKYKPDLFHFELRSEPISDLLAMKPSGLTWEECCLRRASDLLKLKKDRYYISYSGGIDSTVAIVSILRTWPAEDLKKITILMSHQSIEENPTFFDQHICQFPFRHYVLGISEQLIEENALLVSGELGDQLFGSDILMSACEAFGDQVLREDYRIAAPKILDLVLRRRADKAGRPIFDHFHPIVEECPFPIRTSHDFFWWYNFTQKWQHVRYRFLEMIDWNLDARYGSHVQTFFDSVDFQLWSLENHDKK